MITLGVLASLMNIYIHSYYNPQVAGYDIELVQKVDLTKEYASLWYGYLLRTFLVTCHKAASNLGLNNPDNPDNPNSPDNPWTILMITLIIILITLMTVGLVESKPTSPLQVEYNKQLNSHIRATRVSVDSKHESLVEAKAGIYLIHQEVMALIDLMRHSHDEKDSQLQLGYVKSNSLLLSPEEAEAYYLDASSKLSVLKAQNANALELYREQILADKLVDVSTWIQRELAYESKLKQATMAQVDIFVLGLQKRARTLTPFPNIPTPKDTKKKISSELGRRGLSIRSMEGKLTDAQKSKEDIDAQCRAMYAEMYSRGLSADAKSNESCINQGNNPLIITLINNPRTAANSYLS